jgi:phosphopantothenoylcysteine decarboxylase/phosphopantothenate--cysteine ligase
MHPAEELRGKKNNKLLHKRIVLGVTGGIAAYKAAELVRDLVRAEAQVHVVMTQSAQAFITPLTFQTLSGNPVITELFSLIEESQIGHISLADTAEALVIAPATANIIVKIAAGIADDMLTTIVLATKAPVLLAPAMNVNMYQNSITQENLAKLKARGAVIVEPGYGRLASGKVGMGRLAENEKILGTISQVLARNGDLSGKCIVITAGGTQEPIDPVRHIGNRSSGRMGFAVARKARERGASVALVHGAVDVAPPEADSIARVTSACPSAIRSRSHSERS